MSCEQDPDRQLDELTEQYLVFLRGQGPEPDLGHLSAARRRTVRARLQIVDTLFGLDPALPSLEHDPVAIQLGLVPDPPPGGGDEDPAEAPQNSGENDAPQTWPGLDATRRVLDDLDADFAGHVLIDRHPEWMSMSPQAAGYDGSLFTAVAQCSVLGDAVAVFICAADDPWFASIVSPDGPAAADRDASFEPAELPDPPDGRAAEHLAWFLRAHPDVSSVGLVSADGTRATILPASACHRSIDPARGWLAPGAFVVSGDVQLTMTRYFEQRLPRWERVASLAEVLAVDDDPSATNHLVQAQRDALLSGRPRLEHKRRAQQLLRELDLEAVTALITQVQTSQIDEHDFVGHVEALVGDTS